MLASMLWRRGRLVTALLFLCLLIPACGKNKVTKDNYEKIKNDMTLAEVEAILGKGAKDESGDGSGVAAQFGVDVSGPAKAGGRGVDTYVWESGGKTIKVFINNGKVTNKSKEGF